MPLRFAEFGAGYTFSTLTKAGAPTQHKHPLEREVEAFC